MEEEKRKGRGEREEEERKKGGGGEDSKRRSSGEWKYLRVLGVYTEFLMEGVVPDVFHVIPVSDNAILHGVVDLQHGPELAGLIPYHQILTTRRMRKG